MTGLHGKHSSIAPISAKEKSTIMLRGCQPWLFCFINVKTSEIASVSSFSGMNAATTMYPTFDRTQRKKSGSAYLKGNIITPLLHFLN